MLAPGSRVGDFLVELAVAQTSWGMVYVGHHTLMRTPVTFELLRRSLTHDGTGLARFVMDLYSVNALAHPAALRVLAIGEIDDGQCYVVTERPDGPTLEQILEHEAALTPGAVLPLVEQLCHLLGQAHAAGIVHGGIHPNRIVVLRAPPHPTIRVAGFGGGHLGGNLAGQAYTAPEVRAGRAADVRADIYSVGVLIGRLVPFHEPLGPVVRQATADHAEDRYASAAGLFDAVRGAIGEPLPWPASLADVDHDLEPAGREFGFDGIVTVRTALPVSSFVPETVEGPAADELEADNDPVTFRTPVQVPGMDGQERDHAPAAEARPPSPSSPAILAPDATLGELAADEIEADEPAVRRLADNLEAESLADALDDLFDEEGHTDERPAAGDAGEADVPDEPRTALFPASALAGLVAAERARPEDETARVVPQTGGAALTPGLEPATLEQPIQEEPTREAHMDGVPLEAVSTGARPLGRVKLVKVRAADLPEPGALPAEGSPLSEESPLPEESPYLSIEIDGEPVEPGDS